MGKYVVDTVHNGGAFCAFDPRALPEDFDNLEGAQFDRTLLMLEDQSRFWFDPSNRVGGVFCHIYVDQKATIEPRFRDQIESQTDNIEIQCPSGRMWFCGTDYAALDPIRGRPSQAYLNRDRDFLAQSIKIKKGTHKMRVTSFNVGIVENQLKMSWNWSDFGSKLLSGLVFTCFMIAGISTMHLVGMTFKWAEFLFSSASEECCSPSFKALALETIVLGILLFSSVIVGYFGTKAIDAKDIKKLEHDGDPDNMPHYIFEIETS
jgi:hypothetical protein